MSGPFAVWSDINQQYLVGAIAALRAQLDSGDKPGPEANSPVTASEDLQRLADTMPSPPASDVLAQLFGLSEFERDLLLLCAGVELDATFASVLPGGHATFGLALGALPGAHWSAMSPLRPLRRWRLVDVLPGAGITVTPLAIDERVLHFLTGVDAIDDRLSGVLRPLQMSAAPVPSQQERVDRIVALWSQAGGAASIIELAGNDHQAKIAVAQAAGDALGLRFAQLSAADVPPGAADRATLSTLIQRESAMKALAVLLDLRAAPPSMQAIEGFIDGLTCPLAVASDGQAFSSSRPHYRVEVEGPTAGEQRDCWHAALGEDAALVNGAIERISAQFRLDEQGMRAAAREAAVFADEASMFGERLWQACRNQSQTRLDELAQRIEPFATWRQLVLPDSQIDVLRDIARQMRQRTRVYEEWGFAGTCSRGLGISALFAGPSGTGKTMAAEVLANELQLDLFRIDLSQVVSKYIGETEKNLSRVFDAAEHGGAILLFDEADALFGKRSEVRDSHDRYANIEVSYLLQRMETYRGIAILTTNMKEALDKAFLRRLRFIVRFPFPDADQRTRIWEGIFPPSTPLGEFNFRRLAQLNVAGGHIRNIAMSAAFIAAERNDAVSTDDVLRAARAEYGKLDKAISESELRGWQ